MPAPAPLLIDYVSPLPPVHSGIADYSADLLPQLAARCDLRVIRLPGQPVAEALVDRYRPVEASELHRAGRWPFYQMGNNVYHEAVAELAREHPGYLTLHDVFLHHLLVERTLARSSLPPYVRALVADHGWVGGAVALVPRWGKHGAASLFGLPAHRSLLMRQRGILVHSEWAADLLREELGDLPLRCVPMPMPVPPRDQARRAASELRRRLAIPPAAPLFGSFGFQTPIKRTTVAVRALARPGLEAAYLLIGGEVSPAVDLGALVRELGVSGRVKVTGFLPEAEFHAAIAACDLCVNLRYPTAGETSASLLRILAMGCGAVVSDYAQFAALPDEVVCKVPLEHASDDPDEVGALARVLGELVARRERLLELGESARRFVLREHDPGRAAQCMVDALAALGAEAEATVWSAGRPAEVAPPAVPHPTSLTWGSLPSRIEVAGHESPWAEGELRELEIRLTNLGFARFLPAAAGPGGVALEARLFRPAASDAGDRELLEELPWLPLPQELGPGQEQVFRLPLRRPLGRACLRLEPRVLGGFVFHLLGGAVWEGVLS